MTTKIYGRRVVWLMMILAASVLFLWRGVPAQNFGGQGPDLIAPEFVMPHVTKDTNLTISGSFTCDNSKDCYTEGESVPIIGIRGRGRIMNEATGELQFFHLTFQTGKIGTERDQLGGKSKRVAFSATLDLNQYLEQEGIRSLSLVLDAFSTEKEGEEPDFRSLGSFAAVAVGDINADGLVVIAVHLLPHRDGIVDAADF